MSSLFHVTLDLPVELDVGGDVKVQREVEEVPDTVIVHRVKTLEDDDGGGFDRLGRV